VVAEVVDRVIASSARTVAMLGLSFKMNTDDLRESPNVELVERLVGKGFEVKIYDPIVNPERLIGSNLRYIESRLPHLRRLLVGSPAEALRGCDAALVATSDPDAMEALQANTPAWILDLNGRLGSDVERLPGYEGIGWVV